MATSRASSSKSRSASRSGSSSKSSGSRSSSGSSGTKSKSRSGSGRGRTSGAAQVTTDHEQIRQWVEQRGGRPACVKGTGGRGDPGMLRVDYPGFSGEETLQPIDWDEFFEQFEANNLAFLYQD